MPSTSLRCVVFAASALAAQGSPEAVSSPGDAKQSFQAASTAAPKTTQAAAKTKSQAATKQGVLSATKQGVQQTELPQSPPALSLVFLFLSLSLHHILFATLSASHLVKPPRVSDVFQSMTQGR